MDERNALKQLNIDELVDIILAVSLNVRQCARANQMDVC